MLSRIDRGDVDAELSARVKSFSTLAKDDPSRVRPLVDMPEFIRNKAQLISAHLLLTRGARVADMGCGTGEMAYMIAALNPRAEIIGIDFNSDAIAYAKEHYQLPNLKFFQSDVTVPDFEDEYFDAMINSFILHHVYSGENYDQGAVTRLLKEQVQKLKTGGMLLIRDYMMPPEEEFVLIELPDVKTSSPDVMQMSDAELLIAFSQTARPMESGYEGFFIEEIEPKREKTRLFRIPHKWAKEFIYRKDYRKRWKEELKKEYTFYTWQDYRRVLSDLGVRMAYTAPYHNQWMIEKFFEGKFQLYSEDGQPLPMPETNFYIVGQKVAEKQSLILEERRPSQKKLGDLQIMVVRDKRTGELHEIVKRPGEHCDVVPYRIASDGRVVVYVRAGYPRPIINAVSRSSSNLDGRRWSGHLIEPISMSMEEMTTRVDVNRKKIFRYVETYAGLVPKGKNRWYVGPTYFPSPERIDEAIEPVFIEVENPQRVRWPITADETVRFTEIGSIVELDAEEIVQAAQVGLLSDPRLELHVLDLMQKHGMPPPTWLGRDMPRIVRSSVKTEGIEDVLDSMQTSEFSNVPNKPQHLKTVKSVFVEEGRVGNSTRGLSSQDIEFVVTDNGIENIALVLPLTRDWNNNLLIALDPKMLPVPQRLGGPGTMLTAPSFPLPVDVRTVDDARQYIANMFSLPIDQVVQLGESYFTHTGVTPQRVYPFVVSASPGNPAVPGSHWVMMTEFFMFPKHFGYVGAQLCKGLMYMQLFMRGDERKGHFSLQEGQFEMSTDKLVPGEDSTRQMALPSRILGQRGEDVKPWPEQAVDLSKSVDYTLDLRLPKKTKALNAFKTAPKVSRQLSASYAQAIAPKKPETPKTDSSANKVTVTADIKPNEKKKNTLRAVHRVLKDPTVR